LQWRYGAVMLHVREYLLFLTHCFSSGNSFQAELISIRTLSDALSAELQRVIFFKRSRSLTVALI
jgi:hypothetical protein